MKKTIKSKTALITGASGGIGKDFAIKFAQEGHDLIIVARSEDKLNDLAAELQNTHPLSVSVIAADLSTVDAADRLYEAIAEQGLQVDILVNNAGYATYGKFWELDYEREMRMIRLNVHTLAALTHRFLPAMIERGHGKILNVASTAAFQPGPLMANYYATKAFVLSFSEALHNELEGTGVSVTALCPGPTESGFQSRAEMTDSKLVQNGLMKSMDVVNIGYDALQKGRPVVVPGLRNKVLALSTRLIPRQQIVKIVRRMQDRVGH